MNNNYSYINIYKYINCDSLLIMTCNFNLILNLLYYHISLNLFK